MANGSRDLNCWNDCSDGWFVFPIVLNIPNMNFISKTPPIALNIGVGRFNGKINIENSSPK